MNQTITNPLKYLPLFAAITAVTPLAIDMYLPAMPVISEALITDINLLQNSLSIFLFSYALGMFLFGPLADSLGRKKMLVVGLSGYCFFSLLIAFTDKASYFLIYRSFQAIFGGAATLVIPGTIRLLFGKDTIKGLSYVSLIMMIAPLLAPSIGGLILTVANWRLIFLVLAAYSVVILLLSLRFFPTLEQETGQLTNIKKLYLASYKRIFSNRETRGYLMVSMLGSFTFFTYITGVSFIYITVFKLSEMMFGVLFGLNVVVLMLANFTNAKVAPQIGSVKMIGYIWIVGVISASVLFVSAWFDLGLIFVLAGLLPLMGCLLGMIINADTLILLEFAKHTGTATAVIGTLRFGSGALAGPALAFFYDGSALPFASIILAGMMVTGLVHFAFVKGNGKQKYTLSKSRDMEDDGEKIKGN